jgi:hypothetical protein
MKIDNILASEGWESLPNSNGKPFKYYSSITSDIIRRWSKEGKKTIVITGLNYAGYPPCLISPLPKEVERKAYINRNVTDPYAIEWLQNSDKQEIINFLNLLE